MSKKLVAKAGRLANGARPVIIGRNSPKAAEAVMDFDSFLKETLPGLGYDWRRHRRRAVRRKLLARVEALGLSGLDEYRGLLLGEPAELRIFRRLLTVTISRFYRDPHVFDTIRDEVLPALLADGRPVGVWSAGAASGEEPYTLAIIADAYFPGSKITITATDIDAGCIERAGAGIYQESSLRTLPAALRGRYFAKVKGGWLLDGSIKARVGWVMHDLLTGRPPGVMDLVLCRNLAYTYFGPAERQRTTRVLHSAIRPGGYLVLGRTEYLPPGSGELFATQYPADKIYLRHET